MIEINIKEPCSYYNLEALKKVLNEDWKLNNVAIEWNTRELPDDRNPDTWPFKATFFNGRYEICVRIYSLAVGYGGSGPHDLDEILDFLGVKYNEKDIFTKRAEGNDGWIRLSYSMF